MKRVGLLVLAVAMAVPALAQTKPAKPPAAAKGPGQKYLSVDPNAGLPPFGPPEKLDLRPLRQYSLKDCSNFLKWNPELGDEAEVSLVSWCLARTRGAARKRQLLTDLRVYGWADGYSQRMSDDTPLAGSEQCSEIDRMLGADSWTSTQAEGDAIANAMEAYSKLSSDKQSDLRSRAARCALQGDKDERVAAITLMYNLMSYQGYDDGWSQAWKHAWNAGWDAGVKAQMVLDGKVVRDVAAEDDDRYSALVKNYNALAVQFHGASVQQSRGFWASLALALASRPASGSPGSLDSTCTEEVGAWPTTFNCGNVTCVREVGAWPATFDCH